MAGKATVSPTQGQANPQSIAVFRQNTRQNIINVGTVTVNQFGAPAASLQLPRSGWLSRLWIRATGTITTNSNSASGTFAQYPVSPYNILNNVRLYSNTQTDIINMSGPALGLVNNIQRGMNKGQQSQTIMAYANTGNVASLYSPIGTAAALASHAYSVNCTFELPVVTDDAMMLGMIFLQSDQITANIQITGPVQTDILGTVPLANIASISIAYQVIGEFFDIPNDPSVQPNASYVHITREQFQPVNYTGENDIYMLTGNTYLKIMGQGENNSVAMLNTDITSLGIRYAQTVNPYTEPYANHVSRNAFYLGGILPDGAFCHDFTRGLGLTGVYEQRDFVNSSELSDFELIMNINPLTTLTSNARFRIITEQLATIAG
jgi:hypothetical protein